MAKKMHRWIKRPKKGILISLDGRLILIGVLWLIGFAAIIGKLIYVQVMQNDHYEQVVRRHLENRRELPARRGAVLDRNLEPIAVDLVHYSLGVRPGDIEHGKTLAQKISKHVKMSSGDILAKINGAGSFLYLRHRLSIEEAENIRALKLKGVVLEKRFSRYYPYDHIGAHLVGYCDYDNHARAGLELELDNQLTGTSGWAVYLRDALGNQYPNLDFPMSAPQDGHNVETTIDMVYQGVLDEEVRRAVEAHEATNGTAVLMDPRTGEVLGIANYPTFNPNRYNDFPINTFRNRAVTDQYEPGSTFKMVSLAIALDNFGLDLDNEIVFCENGRFRLAENFVTDHKPFQWLSLRRVFENSSNIGVIKLAQKFRSHDFYRYARDFGFGQKTGIDLPAETGGILHPPNRYSRYSVSYLSMGYEVSVTPLQMTAAYAAIANEGRLMQPYIVRKITDANGKIVRENKPQEIRQVVSAATARTMKSVLEGVVINGTGDAAGVDGLRIAGKTGTARKIDRATLSYAVDRHVASFVGFFPVDAPRFCLFVVINNPQKGYYGSQVAAPVFRKIAQRIVGLPAPDTRPRIQLAKIEFPGSGHVMPALEGQSVSDATQQLNNLGVKFRIDGSGRKIVRQSPAAYSTISAGAKILLLTESAPPRHRDVVPDVMGLSVKEAISLLDEQDLPFELQGKGLVSRQMPGPGSRLNKGTIIKLVCSPN